MVTNRIKQLAGELGNNLENDRCVGGSARRRVFLLPCSYNYRVLHDTDMEIPQLGFTCNQQNFSTDNYNDWRQKQVCKCKGEAI